VQGKVVGSILHNLVKQSDRPAELQSTTVVSLLSTCKTRRQGKHSSDSLSDPICLDRLTAPSYLVVANGICHLKHLNIIWYDAFDSKGIRYVEQNVQGVGCSRCCGPTHRQ
jgi:hypothetical protein